MLTQTRLIENLTLFVPSGWAWVGAAVGVLLLLALLVWVGERFLFRKRVPELEVAVVFNPRTGAFSRFLAPGFHHLKWGERIENKISLAASRVSDKGKDIHTYDGILFSIEWILTCQLDPLSVETAQQRYAARWLPDKNKFEGFVRDQVNHCLRIVVGKKSSIDLYRPSMQVELEKELVYEVNKILKPAGIKVYSLMLGAIRGPEKLEKAFEESLKHQVEVEGETKALRQLDQDLVSQNDDKKMRHLEELERIYTLGEHGVALPYRPDIGGEKRAD